MPDRKAEFLAGIKAEIPILIGVIPFGLIYGVLALEAGIPPGGAQAMSAIIFAGSAQILTTQMVHLGAPALVIVLSVGVVNLRHALYSASISPYLKPLNIAWKFLLAYLLTDEAYAVSIIHYREPSPLLMKHWFLLGSGLALWGSWQISTMLGIMLGSIVPVSWGLDFTLALTFIALVVPNLKGWEDIAASLSAGILAVLAFSLPYRLGLLSAALVGILVGVTLEKILARSNRDNAGTG